MTYAADCAREKVLNMAASPLCQWLGTPWKFVLVVNQYVPAAMAALPIANYVAVCSLSMNQSEADLTFALLLVQAGHYVAYSVNYLASI